MKKRKLRALVGYEPGDENVCFDQVIKRRLDDLRETREIASRWIKREENARRAARLWKRAAKAYRKRFFAERATEKTREIAVEYLRADIVEPASAMRWRGMDGDS